MHGCACVRRDAKDRPYMPHSLTHHGKPHHDTWQHEVGHCCHPAVEHAGVVARVQAVAAGTTIIAVSAVGVTLLKPLDTIARLVPHFLQLSSARTDICFLCLKSTCFGKV